MARGARQGAPSDRPVAAGGASDFDLIVVDAAQVDLYRVRGRIDAIGVERVPGLVNHDTRWRNASSNTATHAMPFAWGSLGIACPADLIKEPSGSGSTIIAPGGARLRQRPGRRRRP
jgi:spermidine/putrescine-binding protein